MFSNADLEFEDAVDKDGEKHPLTQGTFIKYLESDDASYVNQHIIIYIKLTVLIIIL